MDISLITIWAAKPGESQGESFAANFNEVSAVDEMGWDGVGNRGTLSSWGSESSTFHTSLRDSRAHPPDLDWDGCPPSGTEGAGERYLTEVPQGASTIDRSGPVAERRRWAFDHLLPADPIQICIWGTCSLVKAYSIVCGASPTKCSPRSTEARVEHVRRRGTWLHHSKSVW